MRISCALLAVVCCPLMQFSASAGAVLYDNFGTDLHKYLNETNAEAGDQITIAPALPIKAQTFTFEYWLDPKAATGKETVEIRFYKNDGGALAADDPTPIPGTKFYDSGLLPLTETGQTRMSISPGVDLPTTFTWTAQFLGGNTSQDKVAGLELYSPPTVGGNSYEFWEKNGTSWDLLFFDEYPASFGAQIIPVPEPTPAILILLGVAGVAALRLRTRQTR